MQSITLKTFIADSLAQIIEGVSIAQGRLSQDDEKSTNIAEINPDLMYDADSAPKGQYFATVSRNLVHMVDFDIAVTVTKSHDAKVGADGIIAVVGIGAEGQYSSENVSISRIKFQVPFTLPKVAR